MSATNAGPGTSSPDQRGFLATLFDINFRSFLTLRFLKVIYLVVLVVVLGGTLIVWIAGLSRGGAVAVLSFFLVPLVGLLYLLSARISLEFVAVLFRIGEDISAIRSRPTDGRGGTAGL